MSSSICSSAPLSRASAEKSGAAASCSASRYAMRRASSACVRLALSASAPAVVPSDQASRVHARDRLEDCSGRSGGRGWGKVCQRGGSGGRAGESSGARVPPRRQPAQQWGKKVVSPLHRGCKGVQAATTAKLARGELVGQTGEGEGS